MNKTLERGGPGLWILCYRQRISVYAMESREELRRTRLTHSHVDACPLSILWHAYCTRTDPTRTGDNKEEKKEEVARLEETLALGSVERSTQKTYLAKLNTWVKERKKQHKGSWWHVVDDPGEALTELLEFIASR